LTPVAAGFHNATDIQFPPGDATGFVSTQTGVIHVIEGTGPRTTPFLDISDRVVSIGESGLLGFAFDPQWPADPYVYVHYTRELPTSPVTYQAVFARYQADPATRVASPGSEAVVLRITKPEDGPDRPGNGHQGGAIVFGSDGHLYLTVGDAQQRANAQMTTNLLGAVLRVDVNGGGTPLDCGEGQGIGTVPTGNPLSDGPGADCDEIFAYGFRNPWRITRDRGTGAIWIGDVGEASWEEVDVLQAGGNYGWPIMEGTHCTDTNPGCDQSPFALPVWDYGRSQGGAISGGYVYRGSSIPWLHGHYVYGDFVSGRVWALDPSNWTNQQIASIQGLISGFGESPSGELYLLDLTLGVYRIDGGPVGVAEGPSREALSLVTVGANPAGSRSSLRAVDATGGPARVVLLDLVGRRVATLFEGLLEPGQPRLVPLDASALPPGVYVAQLITGAGQASARVVVTR